MERYIFLRRVIYFLELCKQEKTGSRKEIANRFEMSDSGVKRMIRDLRDAGIKLEYNSTLKSYIRIENEQIKVYTQNPENN